MGGGQAGNIGEESSIHLVFRQLFIEYGSIISKLSGAETAKTRQRTFTQNPRRGPLEVSREIWGFVGKAPDLVPEDKGLGKARRRTGS